MARKIHIDSDNTIQQWIDSQNTMSDYMGNLDSFRSDILNNFDFDANVSTGANFVTALNYIYDPLLTNILKIFNGTGSINFEDLELRVDSASINILRLENHDSSLGIGAGKNHDGSTLFAADAHVRDSYEDGDSIGSTSLGTSIVNGYHHTIPAFTHDLYVESGGVFNNITVNRSFFADSGTFDMIDIIDSSKINSLTVDSNGTITISQLQINSFGSREIDSMNVSYVLRSVNVLADSAVMSDVNINNLVLDSDLFFDDKTFRTASKFLITDSSSPDSANAPGVIYLGGFKLDSV